MTTEFFKVNGIQVANIHNSSEIALFGIAVLAGSNYETPEVAGIAHFAEHMFFKGTERRDWRQINSEMAKLGVDNNAYTSNNEVFYHTTCPKDNIEPVIDLMLDMFFHSTIPEEELEKERKVIIEEKKMYDDNPRYAFDSAIGENFFTWDKGHHTIGTFETINGIKRDRFISFLEDKVNLGNILFLCCGDISTDDLKRYIAERVPAEHPYLKTGLQNNVADSLWSDLVLDKSNQNPKFLIERENITQSCVSMLTRGLSVNDTCYADSIVLYKAIGGGMFSKLFQKIREELGLCYSVGVVNFPIAYPHHNVVELYGFTSPDYVEQFVEESENVLKDVIKNGIDEELFECAKTDYLASVLRQIETSVGKGRYMLKRYLFGGQNGLDSTIQKIRDVKIGTCNALAEKLLDVDYNWAIMNPKEK